MFFTKKEIDDEKVCKIYNAIFQNSKFPAFNDLICKTGNSTYSLINRDNEDTCERLIKIFEIKNPDLFRKKYEQAIRGDGDEERNMLKIVASSLCSLLFFYNVTESNKLEISLNGNNIAFYNSIFEFKNEVLNNPSNIDITLIGKDVNGNCVILLLESKLSEYYRYTSKKSKPISIAYLSNKISKELYNGDIGYTIINKEGKFILESQDESYADGIKQLISHFIGAANLLDKKYSMKNNYNDLELIKNCIEKNNAKVYLGEILFDERIGDLLLSSGKTCLEDYITRYKKLQRVINNKYKSDRFEMLNDVLLYSMFNNKEFKIEPAIKQFYFWL